MPRPITVSSFEALLTQMFEHWRQLTYFDNESSVFPTDEAFDELQMHDPMTRAYMRKVFGDLTQDFNQLLLDRGIYDWFYKQQYEKMLVNKECVLFV